MATIKEQKSCVPQLSENQERPSNNWTLEQLGAYARIQHEGIVSGERLLTPAYWRLGDSLILAKKSFGQGDWGAFLDELGIHRTRASKARAIRRTFAREEDVQGKSVEEAYAERKRSDQKPRKAQPSQANLKSGSRPDPEFEVLLGQLTSRIPLLSKQSQRYSPKRTRKLLLHLQKAIEQFEQLRQNLKERADAGSPLTC